MFRTQAKSYLEYVQGKIEREGVGLTVEGLHAIPTETLRTQQQLPSSERLQSQEAQATDHSHASRPERSSSPNDQDLREIVEKKWPNIDTPEGCLEAIQQGLGGTLNQEKS